MLEINSKIHDRYTLEFKVGYSHGGQEAAVSDFLMDTWIFIPDPLHINSKTYSKNNFYRDFRSLIRLITPVYTLDEIADRHGLPLSRLSACCKAMSEDPNEENEKAYEHQIKMFGGIVRSALRGAMRSLYLEDRPEPCKLRLERVVECLERILSAYRAIPAEMEMERMPREQRLYYDLGDEYLCRIIDMNLFRAMNCLRGKFPDSYPDLVRKAVALIDREQEYQRKQGYVLPKDGCEEMNRDFIHRVGQLKKYIESDLYILAHKKSNVFVLQQLFFMFAAGISMVFATVISFSFQQAYGNFTRPLFIALVVSYMFKDRFKDLMHHWFAAKLGSKFYDYRIKLAMHGEPIGWGKEGCDFVSEDKLPREIRVQRGRVSELETGHCSLRESVIVHRHRISLYGGKLSRLSHHPLSGVNEIIRINLREFLRRMDSPHVPVYINEGGGDFHTAIAEKVYYLHFVMRIQYDGTVSYRRYRVQLNRRGAKGLQEW